jgi:DNA recombination protein RmuC
MIDTTQFPVFDVTALVLGLVLGALIGALVVGVLGILKRQKLIAQNIELTAQVRAEKVALNTAAAALDQRFKATASEALSQSSEQFLNLAQQRLKSAENDVAHDLEKRQKAIGDMVTPIHKQLETFGQTLQQVQGTDKELREDVQRLNKETSRLVGALRDPAAQGRWGEYILEGLLEKSGLIKGVHYETQVTLQSVSGNTRRRPDVVINLQDGFHIIVDAKAPVNQFVEKLSDDMSEAEYRDLMVNLARQVRSHVQDLGKKDYWDMTSEASPDFTVLFLPSEHLYSLALRGAPDLVDFAASHNVILASPTLLMSLLRVVGVSWRQVELAKNAQEISVQGTELYKRFLKFADHLEKIGVNIDRAMKGYNDAVGSLERSVLPAARKFKELQASGISAKDVPEINALDTAPRSVTVTARDDGDKDEISEEAERKVS